MQWFSAGGVGYVRFRGVGAVRRTRQRKRGRARWPMRTGRLGRRAHRGLAGRANRRRPGLCLAAGRRLRSAGAKVPIMFGCYSTNETVHVMWW